VIKNLQTQSGAKRNRELRIGFVPLTDCAPLVMAQELGLFRKQGLRVRLQRELGWATIRDKIIYGELDGAHALAAMPVAAALGLGSIKCECLTGLVLSLHGNAITLSTELHKRGVRDGVSLRDEISRRRREKIFTFAAVAPFSSHYFLLRKWLVKSGIDPECDVRIVIVPPPQMAANLKEGHLDGFCVGEPWNTVAAQAKTGWRVANSADLDPGHPEKVLMARADFAEKREPEHLALLAALLEACAFCDRPENHEQIAATLAEPQFVGVSRAALRPGLRGEIRAVFSEQDANEPFDRRMAWIMEQMRSCATAVDPSVFNASLRRRVYRLDIFEKAVRLSQSTKLPAQTLCENAC
jgi:ABC-type nitrate/sulfonate/bicarbonate transport system substrate-binding protein